ncbi:MAG: DUF4388 domain-containing protein [Nitrospirota bacterium]
MAKSSDTEIPLSGRLKDNDLIAVLRYLNRNKKIGVLNLNRNDQNKSIYLKDGEVIYAISKYIDDRLGEMLLKLGKITLDQYERSVAELKKGDKKQGTILVELGYISPGDLVWAVKYHAKEIIVSTFSWIDGQYEFTEGEIPAGELITLHMGMANLILEGIKRINDWTRLWNELPAIDTALQITGNPLNLFQDIDLEDREREIITRINGERSIRAIFRESGLKAFETLKMVYFLFRLRMVEAVKEEGTKIEEEILEKKEGAWPDNAKDTELRRQKIIDTHNVMATMDHYQILGLKKGASGDEVKKAYFGLAKEYHPDIHYQEGMDEMKGMLEAIFRKITDAYDVLSVDQKKQEYDLYSVISKHERRKPREEKTDVRAQSQYQRGLDAFKKGDLKEAINSIQWAIKLEPTRPAYHTLLGKILALIPGRIKDAENGFMRAIELEPTNPENHIGLGIIYKKGGMKQRAIRSFEEALVWDPENTEAKKELKGLK